MFAFPVKAHFNTGTHFRVQPQVVSRGTAGNWEQYGKPQQHHDSFRAAFMAHWLKSGFLTLCFLAQPVPPPPSISCLVCHVSN